MPESPTTNIATSDRLVSLDVFRGVTIAGMVLVNNPGTWSSIYWPLEHAEWHGWTPTDLIFPFFVHCGRGDSARFWPARCKRRQQTRSLPESY